jgi:hypothetical protein
MNRHHFLHGPHYLHAKDMRQHLASIDSQRGRCRRRGSMHAPCVTA